MAAAAAFPLISRMKKEGISPCSGRELAGIPRAGPEQHTQVGLLVLLSLEDPKQGWRKTLGRWKNLFIQLTVMSSTLLGSSWCLSVRSWGEYRVQEVEEGEVRSRNYKGLNVTTEEGRTPWVPDGL